MRYIFQSIILLLLLCPFVSFAQTTSGDIRPMLKSLTLPQKLQLLEYLRYLGADIDSEIQRSYELVSRKDQFKTVQFIESFKTGIKQNILTKVKWDRDTLFFDDLTEGTILIDSFQVTNTDKTPYLITQTQTTCDCTVLRVPSHPIMPGETAVLRFEFDSHGKLGVTTPAIIVHDNSHPNKRHILYLKGNISARKKPKKYPWED